MKNLIAIFSLFIFMTACQSDEETTGEPFTISGKIIEDCSTGNPASNQEFALAIPVVSTLRGQDMDIRYEKFKTNLNGEFSITSNLKVYKNYNLSITNANLNGGPGFPILDNIPKQNVDVGTFYANSINGTARINVTYQFDLNGSNFSAGDLISFGGGVNRLSFEDINSGQSFKQDLRLEMSYSSKYKKAIFLVGLPFIIRYKSNPQSDVVFNHYLEVPYNCDTTINLTVKLP